MTQDVRVLILTRVIMSLQSLDTSDHDLQLTSSRGSAESQRRGRTHWQGHRQGHQDPSKRVCIFLKETEAKFQDGFHWRGFHFAESNCIGFIQAIVCKLPSEVALCCMRAFFGSREKRSKSTVHARQSSTTASSASQDVCSDWIAAGHVQNTII